MNCNRWIVSICVVLSMVCVLASGSFGQQPRIVGHWTGLSQSDVGDGVTGELFDYGGSYYYDIGLDTMGRPNLVWTAPTLATVQTNGVVKFAYWDGAVWRGMVNPQGPDSFGPGHSCQIVNTPSGPVVVYDAGNPMVVGSDLRYVLWAGTSWQQQLSTAMMQIGSKNYKVRLDGLARPHFIYVHRENRVNYLYYSFWDGTSLMGLAGSNEGEGLGQLESFGSIQNFSLALDSRAFPHIVVGSTSMSPLASFYLFWDGSGWQKVPQEVIFGFNGLAPRIAVDAGDFPHIAVLDTRQSTQDIYYAYWDGSQFVCPNRDAGGLSHSAYAWAAGEFDMAVGSYGDANIAYRMGITIYLRYYSRSDAKFLTYGFGDIGSGILAPPDWQANYTLMEQTLCPKIAISPQGRVYVAYLTKFVTSSVGGVMKWRPVCRVRAFLPQRAPYPLLALDTTKRGYDMNVGDSAVSLVLGTDNQQDEWVDTDFYLAVSEEQLLYRFSWWCLQLSLPPGFYLAPTAVFTVPITPFTEGGIFCPPVGSHTDTYVIYAGLFGRGTGDALGPIQWVRIGITGIRE